jgi:type VI secretion system FHA domain protein
MDLLLSVIRCPDSAVPETRRSSGADISLGRGQENDWVLQDPDRVVSKRHCVFEFRGGFWQLRDLSANGTFINHAAAPVGRDMVVPLNSGDRVRVGAYEIEARVEEAGVAAQWRPSAPAGQAAPDPYADPINMQSGGPNYTGGVGFGAGYGPAANPALPGIDMPAQAGGLQSGAMPDGWDPMGDEPVMPDHRAAASDAFQPPPTRPANPTAIPDDWDPLADLEPVPGKAPGPAAARPTPAASPFGAAPPAMPPGGGIPADFLDDPFGDVAPPVTPVRPGPASRPMPAARPAAAAPAPFAAPPPTVPAAPPEAPPPAAFPSVVEADPFPGALPFAAPPVAPQPEAAVAVGQAAGADKGFGSPVPPASEPMPISDPFAEPHAAGLQLAVPVDPAAAAQPVPIAGSAPLPMAPVPPPRPAAPPLQPDAALAAFLAGAGINPAQLPGADPAAVLGAAGMALRAAVAGLRALLIARADVKREFRIEQTMLRASGNNPVKFAATDDAALLALLSRPETGVKAVAETVDDLTAHQVAALAATQAGARALIERLAPAGLEATETGGGMFGGREKKLWEAYKRLHGQLIEQFDDDFDSAFGKEFARAYEQASRSAG